jgi:serine/threonine-protein kinase
MKTPSIQEHPVLVAGRFEILGLLGKGGMSEVYRAWDTETDEVVAFKKVSDGSEKQKEAMAREARALARLSHPAILKCLASGEEDGVEWLALEYVPGWDAGAVVRAGNFDPVDFPRVAAQALKALATVHEAGYVHGDIKPGNLMLEKTSGPWRAKLVDFGLCTRPSEHDGGTSGPSRDDQGSLYFLAPERFSGQPVSAAADLYALGAVFYYLLSRRFPVDGGNEIEIMAGHVLGRIEPLERVAEVEPLLARWVMSLLATEPEDRPATALEALRGLASALAQRGILGEEPRHADSHSSDARKLR